jgi:hypothetical protein
LVSLFKPIHTHSSLQPPTIPRFGV